MSDSTTVGIAAFTRDPFGPRSIELVAVPRVRGASVVKPLLFWAGAQLDPFASDGSRWEALARPAVTLSDNDATAELWTAASEQRLLGQMANLTGVAWAPAGEGEHPALRLMVTAGELARAYAHFVEDESQTAALVRRWMRAVPVEQAFGLRSVAAATVGCSEASVGVKCGWFGLERAHAVVVADLGRRTLGAAVTTTRRASAKDLTRARELRDDTSGLALAHDAVAGESIRQATRHAFEQAAEL